MRGIQIKTSATNYDGKSCPSSRELPQIIPCALPPIRQMSIHLLGVHSLGMLINLITEDRSAHVNEHKWV